MNFDAVKDHFKPLSLEQLESLKAQLRASNSNRGETSVELAEVGLEQSAREAIARRRPPAPTVA